MELTEVLRKKIQPYKEKLASSGLDAEMFEECFLSTAKTTVRFSRAGGVFVITGDIPTMWLRDSAAQLMHYVRFADDPIVAKLISGVIASQMLCINEDPYANAFNIEADGSHCKSHRDFPPRKPRVWERKYEIDSLCWPFIFAENYIAKTGDRTVITDDFLSAMRKTVDLFITETDHSKSPYMFIRDRRKDSLENGGHGKPAAPTGMIYSAFRPSDDKCVYNYPVYSNLMVARILPFLSNIFEGAGDSAYAGKCVSLLKSIENGIKKHATVHTEKYGDVYAFEVDGSGNRLLMDDANMPGLLSLPVLGICEKDDPLYLNTRAFVLSEDNPFYFTGSYASGVGSPHTPKGYIWHIALCVQLMTAQNDSERRMLIKALSMTHAGTRHMHESFDPDHPENYTRSWFAWADSMYAEAFCRLIDEGFIK